MHKTPHLDARTSLLLILLVNILFFIEGDYLFVTIASAYAIFLLFLLGKKKIALKALAYFVLVEVLRYTVVYIPKQLYMIAGSVVMPLLMFCALFMYGILFFTTLNISETIESLKKWYVPNVVLIPIIVMARFVPTLIEELHNIRVSMKLRGRSHNVFQKIMNIYVPILFSSIRAGESLTMAAMTKGLGLYKTSTRIKDSHFGIYDFMSFGVLIILIILKIMSTTKGLLWGMQ